MRTSRESFLSRGRVHVWDRQRSNVRYVSFRLQQQCVKGDTKMLFPLIEKKEISELQKKNQSKKPDNFFFIFFIFIFFSSFLEVIISSLLADSFSKYTI